MHAERVFHYLDFTVVGHFAQRLGIAQVLVFQIDGKLIKRLVGGAVVHLRIAL
ncbi:hypothetical protein D3C71_2238330 [compost metagenome]